MAKKRTSLDMILPPSDPVENTAIPSSSTPPIETPEPVHTPPDRKQLAVRLELPVYRQLRTIAFEEETKIHTLLLEGLERVFADRGLPSIPELLARDR